ncbi:LTA synthase family protein [Campylobacter sp. RM16704]|uniref:LTA synthase family protein n=1 Tax=Campylobacter sp. RM16704 TaxID=1500960 RepID=UPI000581F27A|nr:sulfatase-like hydrolase/transferase [Campylobacter sp. RM16704]AJC86658.1 phosphoglycerol transferase [Campylobacter sp. RM16704]
MQINFIPHKIMENNFNDIFKMYFYGIYHDIRFLSVAFLPLLFCGFIALIFSHLNYKKPVILMGGGVYKLYGIISSIYIVFIAYISITFSFAKYYYYELYNDKFNVFLFSVKNDNTSTILDIIYNDYPILKILILIISISLFCVFLNLKIIRYKNTTNSYKIYILLILNTILIFMYILALRGPFKHVALNVQNYSFSEFKVINDIMVNPIMAFSWAYKQHKEEEKLKYINKEQALLIQNQLFPCIYTSKENIFASKYNPSVFLNIMESFGLEIYHFNNETNNFLGSLKHHFEEDFIFERFLPASNGTIPTIANLLFISPFSNISTSKFQTIKLPLTPIEIYKKAGYKVIFISAGNGSWQNIKAYLKTQGVDEIIDENTLIKEYPEAKTTQNGYGIADEYLYKKVLEILQNHPQKTLIISLTISNHPPFNLDYNININFNKIPKELLKLLPFNQDKQIRILKAYTYANDEFGKFLDKFKNSNIKNQVIIAATGDHRTRDLKITRTDIKAFSLGVPFYIYIPKKMQFDVYYDKYRVGSHKDIFPTLYNLSLNKVKYLSLGGRDMLSKPLNQKLEFAINDNLWIDNNGVYIESKGFSFKDQKTLINTDKEINLNNFQKTFINYIKITTGGN